MRTGTDYGSSPFAHKGEEESWQVLMDVLDIRGHLDFVRAYADHPVLSESTRDAITHRLKEITEKQKDTFVNLCVIGGAGNSKSAFINALVGENILTSTAMADSTLIPVVVEYLDSHNIFIQDNYGRYTLESYPDIPSLNRRLTEIATDASRIADISLIRVGIPARSLQMGLRVIDMPASTSPEAWERPVTRELVSRVADLCVILTPAVQAMSQDSMQFVETLPRMLIRNAMAVATHIEHISEKEVDDIRRFVRKRLNTALGIDVPVLAVASSATAGLTGDMSGERMITLTREAVTAIRRNAQAGRHKIQARRMIRLVDSLYGALSEGMARQRVQLEEDLARVSRMRAIPLDPVVKEVRMAHVTRLRMLASHGRRAYGAFLERSAIANVSRIMHELDELPRTTDALKKFLSDTLGERCEQLAKEMNGVASAFRNDMVSAIHSSLGEAYSAIREKFSHIKELTFSAPPPSVSETFSIEADSIDVTGHSESLKKKNDMLENGLMGGAVGGAVIGQMLIPVPIVGAIVGGVLGAVGGGLLFDVNIDKEKKKVADDLKPKLQAFFKDVKESASGRLEDVADRASESLGKEIDRYLQVYKDGIDREIAKTLSHRRDIERKMAETDSLMQALHTRSKKIKDAAEKL